MIGVRPAGPGFHLGDCLGLRQGIAGVFIISAEIVCHLAPVRAPGVKVGAIGLHVGRRADVIRRDKAAIDAQQAQHIFIGTHAQIITQRGAGFGYGPKIKGNPIGFPLIDGCHHPLARGKGAFTGAAIMCFQIRPPF